ncbi:hypothetical protein BO94DRAFT_378630 [Aspergillus sclerotioniger CBS 115572]|uniref:Uncharacterized protein n=1 Tax=Aspergillus sclerotioniger CBS 115572 TaxID=1450535 RepID=A0A317X0E4_9EURO|nr:hypothetical protein BO94DRAFT_378630 [Aspergillus sclerotioniger CBS 115572]PWY91745.1 hypothetical protein BO94DRAFT_378630 [Aspergillus sclerotioniger CBS 115572]
MTIPANPTPSFWATALSSLSEKDRRIFKLSNTSPPDTRQILTEILAALETQRDRCKRDKWTTISIGGKELVIRDVCAKIAVSRSLSTTTSGSNSRRRKTSTANSGRICIR